MKILITGINGFVGKYLKDALIAKGHDVYGIDIESKASNIFAADICNYNNLVDLLKSIKPDIVYHLAAISQVPSEDISILYNVNFKGTLNILKACVILKTKPKFIFISSSQVYGNVPNYMQPINEDVPLNPVNHYGVSKASGEMLVKTFHAEHNLDYIIFRPFNHTGPGQNDFFIIPKIVKAFKDSKNSISLGNIYVERDFLDVRDVVNAYTMIVDTNITAKTYNVSSGKAISINQVLQELSKLTQRKIEVNISKKYLRKNEIVKVVGSYNKIKKELGWEPKIEFNQTLIDMLNSEY